MCARLFIIYFHERTPNVPKNTTYLKKKKEQIMLSFENHL